jgi:hypothetical protein
VTALLTKEAIHRLPHGIPFSIAATRRFTKFIISLIL